MTCKNERHHAAIRLVMKPDERERMYQLCAMIENEKDHRRFLLLIQQLNELLERTERKFQEKNETGPDLTSAGQK